jgi:hypothetical protein
LDTTWHNFSEQARTPSFSRRSKYTVTLIARLGAIARWRSVATHWNDARLVRVFRRLHPRPKFRAIFGSIEKQPMSRPFFFVFAASSDHIIEGDNGERLGRTVTTGIETHKVVAVINNGLNAPVPMGKCGNEVFTNQQLES